MNAILIHVLIGLAGLGNVHAADKRSYLFYEKRSGTQVVVKMSASLPSLREDFLQGGWAPMDIWTGRRARLHQENVVQVFEFQSRANTWVLVLSDGSVLLWNAAEDRRFDLSLVNQSAAAVLFASVLAVTPSDFTTDTLEVALTQAGRPLLHVGLGPREIAKDFKLISPTSGPLSYDEMLACERDLRKNQP